MTDTLVQIGLLFALEPDFISNRLQNVQAVTFDGARATWNVEQWELK